MWMNAAFVGGTGVLSAFIIHNTNTNSVVTAPPPVEIPAVAASTDTEVPAGMGSLDTVIEGMITRSVQKAVADAMPQIVERIVQELRQPRP